MLELSIFYKRDQLFLIYSFIVTAHEVISNKYEILLILSLSNQKTQHYHLAQDR